MASPLRVITTWLLLLLLLLLLAPSKSATSFRQLQLERVQRGVRLASATLLPLIAASSSARGATSPSVNTNLDLAKRILETDSLSYEPGLRERDVFYPTYLAGSWRANSTCTATYAPLGVQLFGGQNSWLSAQKDLNTSLLYTTKFVADAQGSIVADRLFNVESIAIASMGKDCVLPQKQPDDDLSRRLHLVLSPSNAVQIYDIDLYPTDRVFFENAKDGSFLVLERTAQIISTRMDQLLAQPPKPFRKDIETIAIYTKKSDNTVVALQRTATYLTKVDSRYQAALAMNPAVATRAIDIRLYEIVYERIV